LHSARLLRLRSQWMAFRPPIDIAETQHRRLRSQADPDTNARSKVCVRAFREQTSKRRSNRFGSERARRGTRPHSPYPVVAQSPSSRATFAIHGLRNRYTPTRSCRLYPLPSCRHARPARVTVLLEPLSIRLRPLERAPQQHRGTRCIPLRSPVLRTRESSDSQPT
jgi:hypothetical protein